MDEEVLVDGFDLILLAAGATPFFVCPERYEHLDARRAEDLLVELIARRAFDPNWRALSLLGIDQHPCNLNESDLESMVRRHFLERRPSLHARRPTQLRRPERENADASAPGTEPEPSHYIAITAIDEDGEPLTDLALALRLANGDQRIVSTGASGRVRLDRIADGMCNVRLFAR